MRSVGVTVGRVLYIISGILMFVFWIGAMTRWLGTLGTILSFVLLPGLVIFPIVYWIVERVFPAMYFVMWGVGILGLVISAVSDRD